MTHYTEALTPEAIQNYMSQGYTEEQIQEAVNEAVSGPKSELDRAYERAKAKTQAKSSGVQSPFNSSQTNDWVRLQLDLKEMMRLIYHKLRGDVLGRNEKDDIVWIETKDEKNRQFNDHGVEELMRICASFLNINTLMSNYKEEDIMQIMHYFQTTLSDHIFMKYLEMGLDDPEKRKAYPMIVFEIVSMVRSAYLRALHGSERDSLRKNTQVAQSDAGNMQMMPRLRSIANPKRWFGNKYA